MTAGPHDELDLQALAVATGLPPMCLSRSAGLTALAYLSPMFSRRLGPFARIACGRELGRPFWLN
jgi:hypothetical protein